MLPTASKLTNVPTTFARKSPTKMSRRAALTRMSALGVGAAASGLVQWAPRAGAAAFIELNQHGLTGNWYDPSASGQGFNIEIFPNLIAPGKGYLFGGWFTYDTVVGGSDHQRWYTIQGVVETGVPQASLIIGNNVGGSFAAGPATVGTQVGTATISFDFCEAGEFSYAFSDGTGRTGTITLSRLTNNVSCTLAGTPIDTNGDFALSGNWFDRTTPGQGLIIELNVPSTTAFVTWYTYAPNGASLPPASGQRWYTAANGYSQGMRSIPLGVYEVNGGVFAQGLPAPSGAQVGTATLNFLSCSVANFSYAFTDGTNAGLSGLMNLSRLAVTPIECVF